MQQKTEFTTKHCTPDPEHFTQLLLVMVLGPRLGLGVFLLGDLVVAVVVSKLAMAAGAAGCACIGLAAGVVAGGLGVVVAMGRVMGLVRSAIAAVASELGEPEGLCYPDSDCAEAG